MATKIYRKAYEGPQARLEAEKTKIVLTELVCKTTEDNAGTDECELRIWADDLYLSYRRDMDNGETWPLNIHLEFSYRVKIQLWDLDNPGFPRFDAHDWLGTAIIKPGQIEGSENFNADGADYSIEWIPG